ncbi:gas vesicle protein GvpN [Sporohalobacter salinus]|uniref:gas vesicle protein GvpN n=1 Tax=Sporohalobacter salinus TaxID=1494606 RepID=UPI00196126A6|nr:gas vesicle protein GvpN [Sporohalobacter salinus]MBM7623254.1 gas vesicle protein GvpN [Sporohalobacter salinus]
MKLKDIEESGMKSFAETDYIKNITNRALMYLETGYAIHFKGLPGTGKTTLALYVAKLMDRPVQIMFGNEDFGRRDLIGGSLGLTKEITYDNFIHSVTKYKEDYNEDWVEGRLLKACKEGMVLIYDEFTRSRPEINNFLLSILEEGVVELPLTRNKTNQIEVHPDFRMIFTSNPEEYAGVHKTQDALRSRMITLELDFPDRETEIKIVNKNTNVSQRICQSIVDVVRAFRHDSNKSNPTVRSSIMIANILKFNNLDLVKDKKIIRQIFIDVLLSEISKTHISDKRREKLEASIGELLIEFNLLK